MGCDIITRLSVRMGCSKLYRHYYQVYGKDGVYTVQILLSGLRQGWGVVNCTDFIIRCTARIRCTENIIRCTERMGCTLYRYYYKVYGKDGVYNVQILLLGLRQGWGCKLYRHIRCTAGLSVHCTDIIIRCTARMGCIDLRIV